LPQLYDWHHRSQDKEKQIVATKKASPKKKAVAKKPAAKKAAPKKKSAAKPKVSNVDRLVAAGVIHQDHIADHNALVINKLRGAEVSALLNLRKKMGAAPEGKDHLRPNFPV
jgi:hypothetical protein